MATIPAAPAYTVANTTYNPDGSYYTESAYFRVSGITSNQYRTYYNSVGEITAWEEWYKYDPGMDPFNVYAGVFHRVDYDWDSSDPWSAVDTYYGRDPWSGGAKAYKTLVYFDNGGYKQIDFVSALEIIPSASGIKQKTWFYDPNDRLSSYIVDFKEGTQQRTDFDASGSDPWKHIDYWTDANARLDQILVTSDDGSSRLVDYDQSNAFEWSNIVYQRDTAGNLTTTTVNFDSGVVYDLFNDTQGRLDYAEYSYANGAKTRIEYDQTNSNDWDHIDYIWDASRRIEQITVYNDDGTRRRVDYDHEGAANWNYIAYDQNAAGQLTRTTVFLDDGTSYSV